MIGEDIHNWEALNPVEAYALFETLPIRWWVAGGWAIDLFVGRQTREHEDIDVLILRKDQLVVQEYLAGWDLHKTKQPGLKPWPAGEFLGPPVNDVWCRREAGAPWALQFMLMDTEDEEWVYRRCPEIRGLLAALGAKTDEGIPYLRPEVQLLYKAKPESRALAKDQHDFDAVLPRLGGDGRRWLTESLRRQFPEGHEWIERLGE